MLPIIRYLNPDFFIAFVAFKGQSANKAILRGRRIGQPDCPFKLYETRNKQN